MEKAIFVIDGINDAFIGFTKGETWNGFACPYFSYDEATRIMHQYKQFPMQSMVYIKSDDCFLCYDGRYHGYDYKTADRNQHLYPIGNSVWIWDQIYINEVVQDIQDLLWDINPEEIEKQLQDILVLKEIVIILRNEELTNEEKFEALQKELTICIGGLFYL